MTEFVTVTVTFVNIQRHKSNHYRKNVTKTAWRTQKRVTHYYSTLLIALCFKEFLNLLFVEYKLYFHFERKTIYLSLLISDYYSGYYLCQDKNKIIYNFNKWKN